LPHIVIFHTKKSASQVEHALIS